MKSEQPNIIEQAERILARGKTIIALVLIVLDTLGLGEIYEFEHTITKIIKNITRQDEKQQDQQLYKIHHETDTTQAAKR